MVLLHFSNLRVNANMEFLFKCTFGLSNYKLEPQVHIANKMQVMSVLIGQRSHTEEQDLGW